MHRGPVSAWMAETHRRIAESSRDGMPSKPEFEPATRGQAMGDVSGGIRELPRISGNRSGKSAPRRGAIPFEIR